MGPFPTAWTPFGSRLQFLWFIGILKLTYKHFRDSIKRSLTPLPFEPFYGRTRLLLTSICLTNPPLAVALIGDTRHPDIVLSFLLTCLGFLPGVLHALFHIDGQIKKQRASEELRKQQSVFVRLHDTVQSENSLFRQVNESATTRLQAEKPSLEVKSSYTLQDIYQWFISQAQRRFPAALTKGPRGVLEPEDPASVLDNLEQSIRRPFQDRSRLFHLSTKTVRPGSDAEHVMQDLNLQVVPQLKIGVPDGALSTISDSMLNTVSSASVASHAGYAKSAPNLLLPHDQVASGDLKALGTTPNEKALRRVELCSPPLPTVDPKSIDLEDIGRAAKHMVGSTVTAISDPARDAEERMKQRPLAGFVRGLHQIGETKRF